MCLRILQAGRLFIQSTRDNIKPGNIYGFQCSVKELFLMCFSSFLTPNYLVFPSPKGLWLDFIVFTKFNFFGTSNPFHFDPFRADIGFVHILIAHLECLFKYSPQLTSLLKFVALFYIVHELLFTSYSVRLPLY